MSSHECCEATWDSSRRELYPKILSCLMNTMSNSTIVASPLCLISFTNSHTIQLLLILRWSYIVSHCVVDIGDGGTSLRHCAPRFHVVAELTSYPNPRGEPIRCMHVHEELIGGPHHQRRHQQQEIAIDHHHRHGCMPMHCVVDCGTTYHRLWLGLVGSKEYFAHVNDICILENSIIVVDIIKYITKCWKPQKWLKLVLLVLSCWDLHDKKSETTKTNISTLCKNQYLVYVIQFL